MTATFRIDGPKVLSKPIHKALRRLRQDRGFDLEALERETRIRIDYFRAIEAGEIERLPEGLYRRNFIRAYLHTIGVEDEAIVEQAVAELIGAEEPPSPSAQRPGRRGPAKGWLGLASVLVLGGLVAIGILAGPLSLSRLLLKGEAAPHADEAASGGSGAQAAFTGVRARAALPEPRTRAAFTGVHAETAAAARTRAGSGPPPAEAPEPEAEPAAEEAAMHPAPEAPGPEPAPEIGAKALLRATAEVWLRISPKSGRSRQLTLSQGASLELDLSEPVKLLIGNAGGLEVIVGGKALPALGEAGQVRTLYLFPGGLTKLDGP
jgi:cytoskeleton protein RodZ